MFAANLIEDPSCRTSTTVGNVVKPLNDAFLGIVTSRSIEQELIERLNVLDDVKHEPAPMALVAYPFR